MHFQAPEIEDLLQESVIQSRIDEIKNAQLEIVFALAEDLSEEYMSLNVLPSLSEEHKKAGQMIIRYLNFALVKEEERPFFFELSHMMKEVSRKLILHMIHDHNCGFTEFETLEIETAIQMAKEMDNVYMKWETLEHDMPLEERLEKGYKSPWHLIKKEGSEIRVFSFNDLFPKEHDRMIELLETTLKKIDELSKDENPDLTQSKRNYFEALLHAFQHDGMDDAKENWIQAEKAYAHQGGRLKFIHHFEINGLKNLIIPTLSLRFFYDDPINHEIKEKQEILVKSFPNILNKLPKALSHLEIINNCEVGLTYFAVQSGFELCFRIAGHNTPNELVARNEKKALIYLEPKTAGLRIEEVTTLFADYFGEEYKDLLENIRESIPYMHITLHELGHNVGDQRVFTPSLWVDQIEEWKAWATTFVYLSVNIDATSEADLRDFFLTHFALAMRYSLRRGEMTNKPYYGAEMFYAHILTDLKVTYKEENQWKFDLSKEKLTEFVHTIKDYYVELLEIYEQADQKRFDEFAEKHIIDTAYLDELNEYVDTIKNKHA